MGTSTTDKNPFTEANKKDDIEVPITTVPYEIFMSEYERGLLSLAIRNLNCLTELRQKATVDYFLYPPHKIIYTALSQLSEEPDIDHIDLETLLVECKKLGISNSGVTLEYLVLLTQGGSDVQNFQFYLTKVKNAYLKFALSKQIQSANVQVLNNAKDTEKSLSGEELLSNLTDEVSKLATFHGIREEAIDFAARAEDFVLERASNPTDVMGLRTGFPTLDDAINGLMPGTLTIIAGMQKAGKSTVLLNIVDYVAIESANPTPVLIISTEMYTDEDISRTIALRSLIEERKIINGVAYNDPELKPVIDKCLEQIKKSKIYHLYLPDFNIQKICNIIYHYKLKYGIGLAIFDYIKAPTAENGMVDKREDQILGDVTTALKNVAGKLNIPVLTACQINTRTGRVADSDRIGRYANTLIEFRPKTIEELESQDFYKHGTHWLRIFTTRAGGNCKIPIRFWKKCLKLQEAEEFISEEDEQDTQTSELLTTPDEWKKLCNDTFKIEKVEEVLGEADAKDLMDSQSMLEDDPYF